ncbi:vWA domain-containing protein [Algirhabdus cladophorae]|uniref:vWA domain-containing protein n=1 Tax=Algirhabdus cladophorae TaxID=3377108 RepID=UPI003B8459A2
MSSAPNPMTEPMMEADFVLADTALVIAPAIAPKTRSTGSGPTPKAGVLTAGDIDDTLNLRAFRTYQKAAQRTLGLPKVDLAGAIALQLKHADGSPAPHLRVTLRDPKKSAPFFDGYSGVDGNLTVFPAAFGARPLSKVNLSVFPVDQGQTHRQTLSASAKRTVITVPFSPAPAPDFLDLVFVMDTTGSMADELNWLTKDLARILRQARKSAPKAALRYGLVVYRDTGDSYVVRNFGFTQKLPTMQGWLRNQHAAGGGDYPEAADRALQAGVALNWRRGAGKRLLFHVADAPPHTKDAKAYLTAATKAAQQNIQIYGIGASGVAAESEYLMRQASAVTSGRYLFLTDDSGVGHRHAEPTISCYRATDLSSLVTRVIKSELSGQRIEAKDRDIIRRVGSYKRGRCLN